MNFPTESTSAQHRILIVDDEEIVLVALRELLVRQNYQVVTTTDPLMALEHLKTQQFSVVLSDQRMPTLSGLELLGQARGLQPDATRILITAVLSLDTVLDAINKGEIYRFMVKPWLREELLVTMKNAVHRYELICQNSQLQSGTHKMNLQLVELNRSLEQQVRLVAEQNDQLAEANQTLEQNLLHSLELSLHTMETFYPMLGRQARLTEQLCRSMVQVLDLSKIERRELSAAAILYDIGLMGVSRSLIHQWLEDPSSIDPAQRALIEQHPILGEELASFGNGMANVGRLIRAHHERFDGKGYPDRLAGEKIPWLARLLAVAVAYASSNVTREDATEQIKLGAGSAFDPEAVRVFLRAAVMAPSPRKEKQVLLSELRPGMTVARGVYTGNGLLLVPEGQQLNATFIEKLLNHNRVQPINKSLVVYC
jgi:response regulator RpfG family c-di-GMP phosphodiesterase